MTDRRKEIYIAVPVILVLWLMALVVVINDEVRQKDRAKELTISECVEVSKRVMRYPHAAGAPVDSIAAAVFDQCIKTRGRDD